MCLAFSVSWELCFPVMTSWHGSIEERPGHWAGTWEIWGGGSTEWMLRALLVAQGGERCSKALVRGEASNVFSASEGQSFKFNCIFCCLPLKQKGKWLLAILEKADYTLVWILPSLSLLTAFFFLTSTVCMYVCMPEKGIKFHYKWL